MALSPQPGKKFPWVLTIAAVSHPGQIAASWERDFNFLDWVPLPLLLLNERKCHVIWHWIVTRPLSFLPLHDEVILLKKKPRKMFQINGRLLKSNMFRKIWIMLSCYQAWKYFNLKKILDLKSKKILKSFWKAKVHHQKIQGWQ